MEDRKAGHAGSGEPWSEARGRAAVAARSQGRCEASIPGLCVGRASNVHHRRNRSQGGTWCPDNLLHLCGSGTTGCHGWVTHNPTGATHYGLALQRHQDDGTPVLLFGSPNGAGWWSLREDTMVWTAPPPALMVVR